MIDKGGGCGDPKKNNSGIECVHEITRQEDLHVISFAETNEGLARFVQLYLFKEQEVEPYRNKESAADDADLLTPGIEGAEQLRKHIGCYSQRNIAERYAYYKSQSALYSIIDALLDDGK